MIVIICLLIILIICFGSVLLVGAPYLPTLSAQVETALELADLKTGQTLLELGCGDGKVLIAAARHGLNAVGYELNPILFAIAWLRTRRYRGQVKVIWGDFWRASWPNSQAIFVFLIARYMSKLDTRIVRTSQKPLKLASFAFPIPGKRPAAVKAGIYLYEYD